MTTEKEKLKFLKKANELLKNSKLTEADTIEIGRKIKNDMWKKYYKN